MIRRLVVVFLGLLLATVARADRVILPKPMYVEIFIRATGSATRDEKLAGNLTQYDDDSAVVKSAKGDRTVKWLDLTSASAFTTRARLIDKEKAADWFALGKFGWSIGATSQAKLAFASAVRRDAKLSDAAQKILDSPPGDAAHPATQPSEAKGPTSNPSLASASHDSSGSNAMGAASAALPPGQSGKRLAADSVVKYQKSTPEENAKAIEAAQANSKKVGAELKVTFVEIQTDHFIIFTDWDAREYDFLKKNLEGAYTVVSMQFQIPVKENVFVGKLPVYMFAKHSTFRKFATTSDHFAAPETVAGYYSSRNDGTGGHMAMWKPDIADNNVEQAQRQWAYVLTHEFTHAFVARYRTNQRIPRWLNEGVAEVIANSQFPRAGAYHWAHTMATTNIDFSPLFDDDIMPGGQMYPVMMTMAQTLITHDHQAFLEYFDDLKAGVDPDDALKKHFNLTNNQLIIAWKAYAKTLS